MMNAPLDMTHPNQGRVEESLKLQKMRKELSSLTEDQQIEYFVVLKNSVEVAWDQSNIERYTDLKAKIEILKQLIVDKNKLFDAVKADLDKKKLGNW